MGEPAVRGTGRAARSLAALSDAELVARAKERDRAALDTLLQRHVDLVHAVCRRITGSEADAADAAQDAMVAIVRGLPRFDGTSAFTTWAYRIATNASLDELRRRRRRPDPVDVSGDRGGGSTGGGTGAGRGADARGEVGSVALADPHGGRLDDQVAAGVDVDRALAGLPPDYRAAVVLRDLCGLDYAEIADILGIPGGTVRSRIARGRAALVPLVGGNPSAGTGRPKGDDA